MAQGSVHIYGLWLYLTPRVRSWILGCEVGLHCKDRVFLRMIRTLHVFV
jgi:hypothetical protein